MNWFGLVVAIVGLYLVFKVVRVVLKLGLWVIIAVAGYWFLAPYFSWPPLDAFVRTLGS